MANATFCCVRAYHRVHDCTVESWCFKSWHLRDFPATEQSRTFQTSHAQCMHASVQFRYRPAGLLLRLAAPTSCPPAIAAFLAASICLCKAMEWSILKASTSRQRMRSTRPQQQTPVPSVCGEVEIVLSSSCFPHLHQRQLAI